MATRSVLVELSGRQREAILQFAYCELSVDKKSVADKGRGPLLCYTALSIIFRTIYRKSPFGSSHFLLSDGTVGHYVHVSWLDKP